MLINCSTHPDFDSHDAVHSFRDEASGLRAIVAIHRPGPLGVAGGGCRMWPYASEEEALRDVLRLSKAMSYKLVLSDVVAGGAKCVIIGDAQLDKSEQLLRALGRAIGSLKGRFVVGGDVGIGGDDLDIMAQETPYVERGSHGRDTVSEGTAHGVRWAMRAAAQSALGVEDLRGIHVAIQGLGKVGGRLARLLAEDGARLSLSDVDEGRVEVLAHELGAARVAPAQIARVRAEIFSPCALSDVLNRESVEHLECRIVVGAANNQLAGAALAQRLRQRGIVYVPDFVANMGGTLAGAKPHACMSAAATDLLTRRVSDVVTQILEDAHSQKIPPEQAAITLAQLGLRNRETAQSWRGRIKAAAFQRLWRSPVFAEGALRGRMRVEGLREKLSNRVT